MTTASPAGASLPAKRPATKVAGPYGHPFHPILVTVPIGAWVVSLVLDVASRTVDDGAALGRAAWWLIGLGIAGALLAAVFGLLDYLTIPAGTKAKRVGTAHLTLNLLTVAAFAASFLLRFDDAARETGIGLIVLSALALGALSASGWLGGTLSYHYGVRVADEIDQASGFRA